MQCSLFFKTTILFSFLGIGFVAGLFYRNYWNFAVLCEPALIGSSWTLIFIGSFVDLDFLSVLRGP
jgi:hypothetical protein